VVVFVFLGIHQIQGKEGECMIEHLKTSTLRLLAFFNDLLLFGLLSLYLPLPFQEVVRILLGLSLLWVMEIFWGKTPGSLLAGYRWQQRSRSKGKRLQWFGVFCVRCFCFLLLIGVGWCILSIIHLWGEDLINSWHQPILAVFVITLIVLGGVLAANFLSFLLIEALESQLKIEIDWLNYSKHWGPFLSLLPLIGTIISFVILPNMLRPESGEKLSSVKANMHTLETMLENYSSDWQGVYPESLKTLEQEAKQTENPYWKEMVNPYTSLSGSPNTLANEKELPQAGIKYRGFVSFEVPAADLYRKYTIYGYDKHGKKIAYKDKLYILSNAWD
jgi:type II secretory pathway pseudopilin PulG